MSSSDQTPTAINGTTPVNRPTPNGTTAGNEPTPNPTTPSNPPDVSTLPPAALDLATKLFSLARSGTTPLLSTYLTAGIPPNLTNSSGDTLLMLASYHGHAPTVTLLLSFGADPNVLNDRGQSPIAGAVFKGYEDVVRVLFEGGADVLAGHPTAVDCARMFQRGGMCELFGVEMGDGRGFMRGVDGSGEGEEGS